LSLITKEVVFRDLVTEIPSTTYATFALYNYPAKFIPQVVSYVLKHYAREGYTIFDPFAGYGTVGVVSRLYGLDYELWDLNPMLAFLHKIAVMKPIREMITHEIVTEMERSKECFVPNWSNLSYWFPNEVLPFLFKVWGYYHSLHESKVKSLILIPLLKATRMISYNDAQRQKLSKSDLAKRKVALLLTQGWKKVFFQSFSDYMLELNKKLEEYEALEPKPVKSKIRAGIDAVHQQLEEKVDILVTSPPYLQAQEYIRNSKLDLFWLGYTEEEVRELSSKEIPYGRISQIPIGSHTYWEWREKINEERIKQIYDRYFWGVLGALTKLQDNVNSSLCLFVGPANLRGCNVPIPVIFAEHFTSLGWKHEATLVDTIVARRLFNYGKNPATGISDNRMLREHMLILRK
jgi:DNA modification methylase